MNNEKDPLSWTNSIQDLLTELRCADNANHRIKAAELLLDQDHIQDRNSYLFKAAFYDPDPLVRDKILRLMYDHFGNSLYKMLDAEPVDETLPSDKWLIQCSKPASHEEIDRFNEINLNYESILKEIRCEIAPQHRIQAARKLIGFSEQPERIPYLINVVLYDPDPEVRKQVKELLFELYGNEIDTIIQVEGADGKPIESPWMLSCRFKIPPPLTRKDSANQEWRSTDELEDAYRALRDPLDINKRLSAAKILAKNHSDENMVMLAKAVLFDPDENMQQQAYQSLYEAAGDEKAEALLNQIGAESMDESEEWLLVADYFDEFQSSLEENEEVSPFGFNKADQIRGMTSLFIGESDPQKRISILKALAKSNDVTANDAIARVGLFDADERVRQYAKNELQNRLGDHLDEFLDHIYNTSSTSYPDPDNEENQTEISDKFEPENDFSIQLNSQPPVIEEGSNLKSMVLISIIVIAGLVLYLILK